MNESVIQSYVKRKFFVSTVYRESSAMVYPPPKYYETIIWEWDSTTRKSGKMLSIIDSGRTIKQALKSHFGICANIFKKD